MYGGLSIAVAAVAEEEEEEETEEEEAERAGCWEAHIALNFTNNSTARAVAI